VRADRIADDTVDNTLGRHCGTTLRDDTASFYRILR